jgi:hypothetical protein
MGWNVSLYYYHHYYYYFYLPVCVASARLSQLIHFHYSSSNRKQELIDRFRKDNSEFSEERATEEVERFLMDPEMVNAFIQYEKNMEENPTSFQQEAESTFKDPKTIATYAAYLVAGSSIGYIRKTFFPEQAVDVAASNTADAVASIASNVADVASNIDISASL